MILRTEGAVGALRLGGGWTVLQNHYSVDRMDLREEGLREAGVYIGGYRPSPAQGTRVGARTVSGKERGGWKAEAS